MTSGMILFAEIMDVYGAYVVKARLNILGAVKYDSIYLVFRL